jgi:hypothetical protein
MVSQTHSLALEYPDYDRMKEHLFGVKYGYRYDYFIGTMLCDARLEDTDLDQFAKLVLALSMIDAAIIYQVRVDEGTVYFVQPRRGKKGASAITREVMKEAERIARTI